MWYGTVWYDTCNRTNFSQIKERKTIDPSQEADILPQAVQAEIRPHREEAIYSIQALVLLLREVLHQAGSLQQGIQEEAGSLRVDRLVVGKVDCPVMGACLLVMKGEDRREHHLERRGWGREVGRGACRGLLVLLSIDVSYFMFRCFQKVEEGNVRGNPPGAPGGGIPNGGGGI